MCEADRERIASAKGRTSLGDEEVSPSLTHSCPPRKERAGQEPPRWFMEEKWGNRLPQISWICDNVSVNCFHSDQEGIPSLRGVPSPTSSSPRTFRLVVLKPLGCLRISWGANYGADTWPHFPKLRWWHSQKGSFTLRKTWTRNPGGFVQN